MPRFPESGVEIAAGPKKSVKSNVLWLRTAFVPMASRIRA